MSTNAGYVVQLRLHSLRSLLYPNCIAGSARFRLGRAEVDSLERLSPDITSQCLPDDIRTVGYNGEQPVGLNRGDLVATSLVANNWPRSPARGRHITEQADSVFEF